MYEHTIAVISTPLGEAIIGIVRLGGGEARPIPDFPQLRFALPLGRYPAPTLLRMKWARRAASITRHIMGSIGTSYTHTFNQSVLNHWERTTRGW